MTGRRPCSAGSRRRTRHISSGRTPAGSRPTVPGRLRRPPRRLHVRRGGRLPHFDSLLVKLTCRGRTFPEAVARAQAGVGGVPGPREWRPISRSSRPCLDEPDFIAGDLTTSFIDERPALLSRRSGADRGTRLAHLPGRRHRQPARRSGPWRWRPREKLPQLPRCSRHGSGGRKHDLAAREPSTASTSSAPMALPVASPASPVAVTDTTLRDAHQSLAGHTGSGPRTCCAAAPYFARTLPRLLSLEAWGGRDI